jgi:hypothetical protein
MTHPVDPALPSKQPTRTAAVRAVTGRVFLLNSAQYTIDAPAFLDVDRSGLAVYGVGGHAKISRISPRASTPLLVDPGAYTDHLATADEPFDLPAADGALFPVDLDSVLQGQRECHAAAAITPSRYVQAGDSAAFKGLVRHAQAIERDDVIVAVPVAISWLKEEQYLPQLIAGLNRIPQPKALMFGEQKNPFDAVRAIVNLRRLLAATSNVGLWRADVPAAFDCLAHGGDFAAVGAGGSLRHLVPADEKARSEHPMAHTPSVLLPALLRYSTGRFIADRYANIPAPRCACGICKGASLDRFNSLIGEVRAEAHAHNAAVWNSWLGDLFEHPTLAERQRWWRGVCKAAVDAHDQENARLRQRNAFQASPHLKKLASLPLPGEAAGH